MKKNNGFGLIEVIVAMGIFVIIAVTGATTVVHTLAVNRLGDEETEAYLFAQEGIEAVRSIKNQGWLTPFLGTNCASGCGLSSGGGSWAFSGSNNTLSAGGGRNYTRTVTVEQAQRDGSGNIVDSGGTADMDLYKVTSTVNWDFTTARNNTVSLITYLTRWEKPVPGGGMLVYSDTSLGDGVRYKILDASGSWGSEQTVPDFGVPNNRPAVRVKLYESPTRDEKILVTKHYVNGSGNDQYIYAQVWDGSNWGDVLNVSSWSGNTNYTARDFDGDYLANGNFLFVYEDNSTTPKYRTWDGSNWSSEGSVANVGGNPDWIVVRSRPNTNTAMMVSQDSGEDTNTSFWNGASWSSTTEHGTDASGTAYDSISFVWSRYDTTRGALFFDDDNNDATPAIKIYNTGTSSWSSLVENVNVGGQSRANVITDRPTAAEFLACVQDNANDINCMESNFTPLWSSLGEIENNMESGTAQGFSLAYESLSGDPAVAFYSGDASQNIPKYRTYNPSTNAWGSENSLTSITSDLETVRGIANPISNDIMFLMGASDQDVWSVVWDGANNDFYASGDRSLTEHGTTGTADNDVWFDFAWDI